MYYLHGSKTVVSQASATRKGSMMEVWDRQHEGTLAWRLPSRNKKPRPLPSTHKSGFVASVFEMPPEFEGVRVGDQLHVSDDGVMGWMVNQDGVLRGGFSLRHQRSLLPAEMHASYAQYIGVSEYG